MSKVFKFFFYLGHSISSVENQQKDQSVQQKQYQLSVDDLNQSNRSFTSSSNLMAQNSDVDGSLIERIEPNISLQQYNSNHSLQHHLNGENRGNLDLENIDSNNSQFHNTHKLSQKNNTVMINENDNRHLTSNDQFASSTQQLTSNTSEGGNMVANMSNYPDSVQSVNTSQPFDGWYNVGIIKGTKYFVSQFIYSYSHQQNIISEVLSFLNIFKIIY